MTTVLHVFAALGALSALFVVAVCVWVITSEVGDRRRNHLAAVKSTPYVIDRARGVR